MQPLVPGTMLYPGRCGVWQPVAANTSVPVAAATRTEVPKESIIANTDFTTTSLIAKRRLSSKKRRMQHLNGSTGSDISTESSAQSPASSTTGSPSMACTPGDKIDADPSFGHREESAMRTTAAGGRPPDDSSGFGRAGGQYMPIAGATHPQAAGLLQNQIANPMLSQLQQGLNYRFLQEQSLLQQQQQAVGAHCIEHPRPITSQRASSQSRSVSCDGGSGFKWSVAHVVIANQIRHHKQQQGEGSSFHIHPSLSSSTSFQSPPNASQSHTPPGPPPPFSTSSQQPQQPRQQQQPHTIVTSAPHMPHLALMQYSFPQTNTTAANLPPGYMAVPYTSLQDLQLRMNQQSLLHPHVQMGNGIIPVVKPVLTMADIGLDHGCVQVMAAGIPLQQQQQQQQMAQFAMAHNNAAMMQGPSVVAGSWVAPLPVMNNPFQPDTMVAPAPWVK